MGTKCLRHDCWRFAQDGQAYCPDHQGEDIIRSAIADCKHNGVRRTIDGSKPMDHDDARCIGCIEFIGKEISSDRVTMIIGELCRKRGHKAEFYHPKCADYRPRPPYEHPPESEEARTQRMLQESEEIYAREYGEEADGFRVQADA